jgi:nucleoside-diphosphate-sugar epimerase
MYWGPAGQILESIYRGLNYYPSGSSGYVDVRDVARIMIVLTDSQLTGERFILNAGNITHQHYLNLLAKAMGRPRPGKVISPLLARIGVIAELILSVLKGTTPRINLRTLEIASEKLAYSNARIIDKLGVHFIPIEESVQVMVQHFLAEKKANSNKD